jgi:alkylation response protein AidB-like acyl-CoA dehydrogenase
MLGAAMDFTYPPETELVRAAARAWLDENLDDDLRALRLLGDGSELAQLERLRGWNRKLADAGWAAVAWPGEYGGRDAGPLEALVVSEEMSRANAPGPLNPIGLANIAPAIMAYGTPEQKLRFLRPMLRGDHIWSQAFSEPDAGSDLADLRTRAERDGDAFVVNGAKIWNTLGHIADYCELLVRTDLDAPKHKGITCLLVDLRLPGIEIRPLVNIVGESDFTQIFFDDVRVPASAQLGPVNEGWRVAMATLAHERGGVAHLHPIVRRRVDELWALARSTPLGSRTAADDPLVRQSLATVTAEAELLRLVSFRALSAAVKGRPPGPESSIAKLHWTSVVQHAAEIAAEIAGSASVTGDVARGRVSARSSSIAGGTTQVNKNVIATRILGLPRSH